MENGFKSVAQDIPHILSVHTEDETEVLRIANDGRIFWRQREVETDDDFRSAMLEL